MSRHKSRVTHRGRRIRKGRAGTRKQSGGWLGWLLGKKTDAAPATLTPGAVAPATPGAVAPNAAAKPWWNPFGGGGRKKSRKTSHRRHHHHRK